MTWKDIFLILRHPVLWLDWDAYRYAQRRHGDEVVRFRPWLDVELAKNRRPVRYTNDTSSLKPEQETKK